MQDARCHSVSVDSSNSRSLSRTPSNCTLDPSALSLIRHFQHVSVLRRRGSTPRWSLRKGCRKSWAVGRREIRGVGNEASAVNQPFVVGVADNLDDRFEGFARPWQLVVVHHHRPGYRIGKLDQIMRHVPLKFPMQTMSPLKWGCAPPISCVRSTPAATAVER